MTISSAPGAYVERSSGAGLADVVGLILDKGLVIDAFVRVSLVGIEIINIDARVVVASVDTYLRFAEATNRLDLYEKGGPGLPDVLQGVTQAGTEGVARGKTKGMVEAAKEAIEESLTDRREEARERRARPVRREREP
jgi:gas vesicle structural protein